MSRVVSADWEGGKGTLTVALAPLALALAIALRFPVGASVAFNAVLELLDALFLVFAPHIGHCVFVTSVAGVSAEAIAGVAGHT